jgi:hypothetical protein
MNLFGVLDPFFHRLSDGKIIRQTVAWVLRIQAIIMALIGLYGCISIIRIGVRARNSVIDVEGNLVTNAPISLVIGCILLALFVLVWGYLTAGILTYRARSVHEMGDSQYTALSILSILFRLNGELAFITYSLIGVGGCLFTWIADSSPFPVMGMLGEVPFAKGGDIGFLGGLEMAIFFLLIAFALIVFFYALAEYIAVQAEIALNTRGLRK